MVLIFQIAINSLTINAFVNALILQPSGPVYKES